MKDDKLLQRFLDDQSKTVDASQPASPHQNETTPSTNDARVANGGRGHQTISHTKSITFTPSMFGYDDIDAESSVSQNNPDRKPLRAPSRDTPAANAPTGQSNSERQVPRSFHAPPPPLTSPAKATGATLEQVRDQVREHRTERKREQKARLLGRPVSKGGKRATADAEDKQGAAAAKSGGGILRDKVIDKKRKQAPGSKQRNKGNKYHEALIHDATVAGKSRLTLPVRSPLSFVMRWLLTLTLLARDRKESLTEPRLAPKLVTSTFPNSIHPQRRLRPPPAHERLQTMSTQVARARSVQ
ncbi:hypothetical protein BCR44DRAFT_1059210 [Catenaria anguillulae PL171]|uniref:Uncharacterized protein n=1 Tax=Catenaria anguillulae PL171 TaxID=765915 RepID=A0A1Y2HQA6_9FUNG|nr:hypothetical protein BCR44DRAFT_1059210 [Catenaria anguillulae PL171]